MINAHIAIISANRWQNVPRMTVHLMDQTATWYVPEGQGADYRWCGALDVVEVEGLAAARNLALEHAFERGLPCIQTDDDLRRLEWTNGEKRSLLTLPDAAQGMLLALEETGYKLAGAAPTPNAYFYHKPIGKHHVIIASLCAILPNPLRFDTALPLKEDYDYTLQHLREYGGVARVNGILPTYQHYTNAGGAVDVRSSIVEQKSIAYLQDKWGKAIRLNPKRQNEILINWRRVEVPVAA